ncbi:MAG: putative NADH-flavin reductase [Candidatus Eremiobacteraeota bacterium]|nr:putative NADH-flavin reductase [Candidatus Eremiobacteraeota bacterium]
MKIAVLGAAGGIGRHVVTQVLDAGHSVTALLRDPRKLTLRHERLAIVRGDVLDGESIRTAIAGHDAVVSAMGVRDRAPTTLYSVGARNALTAMTAEGVRRYIAISASGFHIDANDPLFLRYVGKPIVSLILKEHYKDLVRMESVIAESDRDWTIVVPPRLTDGPRTGRYREALDANVRNGQSISRADVADYIVKLLAQPTQRPALAFIAY